MTEEVARSLFSSFGLVESVCIVKSTHSIKKSLSVDDVEKKSDDAVQVSRSDFIYVQFNMLTLIRADFSTVSSKRSRFRSLYKK